MSISRQSKVGSFPTVGEPHPIHGRAELTYNTKSAPLCLATYGLEQQLFSGFLCLYLSGLRMRAQAISDTESPDYPLPILASIDLHYHLSQFLLIGTFLYYSFTFYYRYDLSKTMEFTMIFLQIYIMYLFAYSTPITFSYPLSPHTGAPLPSNCQKPQT